MVIREKRLRRGKNTWRIIKVCELGEMKPNTEDLAKQFGMEVMRQLANKTQGEKFLRVEIGEHTHIVGFVHPDPCILEFETRGGMLALDKFLEPVATSLLLQIREGSYKKIAELPLPEGPHQYFNWRDPASNLSVRSMRFFEPQAGKMFTKFEIGVEP